MVAYMATQAFNNTVRVLSFDASHADNATAACEAYAHKNVYITPASYAAYGTTQTFVKSMTDIAGISTIPTVLTAYRLPSTPPEAPWRLDAFPGDNVKKAW
jgi:hypothetical protein